MKNYLSLSLLLLLFAAGCSESPEPETEPTPDPDLIGVTPLYIETDHFVLGFYEPACFRAETGRTGALMHDIYLWGSEVGATDRDETHPMCVHLKSTGADAERYEALCARYGDLHKNSPAITTKMLNGKGLDHCVRYFYPAYSLVSIEVTCEEAYDAEHPAGASLNDLCRLLSASPREYIADGCESLPKDEWSGSQMWNAYFFNYGNRHEHRIIDKRLDECRAEDFLLMGVGNYLYCWLQLPVPEDGTMPPLRIRVTDERGKVYDVEME